MMFDSWTTNIFNKDEFPIRGDLIIKDQEGKMFAYGMGSIAYGDDDIKYIINIKNVRYPIPECKIIKTYANDYPTLMRFIFFPINDRVRKIESDFAKLDATFEITFEFDFTEMRGRIMPMLHYKHLVDVYPHKQ